MQRESELKVDDVLGIAPASERAEQLANLLSLSHEAMIVWRLDGTIEFWNAGAGKLYGFTRDEAIGRSTHALLQTRFPADFITLRSQLKKDRTWSGELSHVRKDGHMVVVDSRMQLFDDDIVLEVNRDITAVKEIEAALRQTDERLRYVAAIVESSDDAIVSKNLDGVITSWNKGAERIFGFTAEEAVGRPITIVIPEDRLGEEREILTRIRRGERIDHFETLRRRKHGSLIVASITVSPVKNAEGRIIGASKIARDITEQRRSQEQIATLAREAEHRSKNLLANVHAAVQLSNADTAHELKKAIQGRIQALANVNSLFVETRWIGAELSSIAGQEFAPYMENDKRRVRIAGPPVLLEPSAAQAIAVTLHELATNAAKYGALSAPDGRIDLTWSHEHDGRVSLCWTETGGPPAQPPTRRGFGTRVIEQMIAQLKGKTDFDWRTEGLICNIELRA